ncbi:anoctamin-1-like [Oncorhynchus tshawytscha]|uniref:Anoctamin n=1 Tax=Oncorhynchus tshawytscha TaxID=74940 RepID=A0AAZ3SGT6_ONCTS|nr:anoctamin-1-like [Oncorhynchus tshawytscha]
MNRSSLRSEAWNGTERMRVARAMGESSSVQSEKLRSLACSLSEMGLDNGNPPGCTKQPTTEPSIELGKGTFFADGQRKVDYILCYNYKKRRISLHRLSLTSQASNGSLPLPSMLRRDTQPELEAGLPEGEESQLSEEEKAMMREEFESGLLEQGLQLERDKESRSQGIGFIRLHVPWATLSREAELQKIKVPVKKSYELRQPQGIAGKIALLYQTLIKPFRPDVPETLNTQSHQNRTKTLSHPFSRDKLHLFEIKSQDILFDYSVRSRIVKEILTRTACTQTCQATGISSLLATGVYNSAFPPHDGSFTRKGGRDQRNDRQLLYEEWANYGVMFKYQPLDLIRKYFGEAIGLYFAWMGVYTRMLVPPSLLGLIVFLYGVLTVNTNVPSQEMCDDSLNFTMCPLCDAVCDYWKLSSVCSLTRASYLFDNGATTLFAIFMSLWAAFFLEHWKRRQMCLKHAWDLTSLEDEEETPRPEYDQILQEKRRNKSGTKRRSELGGVGYGEAEEGEKDKMLSQREQESLTLEDRLPGYMINVSVVLMMMGVTFSAVFGVILYRITMLSIWSMNPDPEAKASVRMTVTTTAIIINLLVVLILDEIYGAIAVWLTKLEVPKTEAEFEERLILKSFLLKSMNTFAPVFYVAFFKGRFAGPPGDYVYLFGHFRMEECAPPGCLIELCIQLSMIMLGKQLIQNNVFEIVIPKLKKMYRTYKEKDKGGEEDEDEEETKRPKQQWDKDFSLDPYEGLSPEYMEMIIQYGFVTIFVASFPLAPLFALLNNVIEIRLDAAKFTTEIRRPDAVRCKDIGIWFNILIGISKFSVITNAFVISFTSDFIPRTVYQYMYSQTGSMHGFTEHSLSYFNVSNFEADSSPSSTLFTGVTICRYKDYRDPPWGAQPYSFSKQYWSVLAARLAFVIFFQNLAMFLSMLVAWLIPDVPRSLREQVRKENMLLMEFLVQDEQEALRSRLPHRSPTRQPAQTHNTHSHIDIVVEGSVGEEGEEEEKMDRSGQTLESPDSTDPAEGGEEGGGKDGRGEEGKEEGSEEQSEGVGEGGEGDRGGEGPDQEEVSVVDLDSVMDQLYLSDPEPSQSLADMELPVSGAAPLEQEDEPPGPDSPPAAPVGDTASPETPLANTHPAGLKAADSRLFSRGPPLIDSAYSRTKGRCSTLPPKQRGPEPGHSRPRPSHSTSLTKFHLPPLHPLAPSPSPTNTPQSPPPKPLSHSELFMLKGPPRREPGGSSAKGRCSTLPARQRGPEAGESSSRPSHSSSFTRQEDRIPPSPSELKQDTPV